MESETALKTISKLGDLHKTALKTLVEKYSKPGGVAYETMAEELASGMMSVAMGVDPAGVCIDLAESWRALAEDSVGVASKIFTAWALTIEKIGDE